MRRSQKEVVERARKGMNSHEVLNVKQMLVNPVVLALTVGVNSFCSDVFDKSIGTKAL